jgi:tetratricopeptide (TPR) repeat protein
MSAPNRIQPGILLALAVLVAGCGHSTPAPLGATTEQTPRHIELPAGIRPLIPERADQGNDVNGSIRVEYQQPQPQADTRPTYNVELATSPQTAGSNPVREPLAAPPAADEAPATPPNRSSFIPISMPQPSVAPPAPQAPTLPAAATFAAAAPTGEGPQLTAPATAAIPSPDAGKSAAPAMPQPESTQPRLERWVSTPIAPAALPESRNRPVIASSPPGEPQVALYQSSVAPQSSSAISALQAVGQRALQMADHASATAQRGMFFSARNELLQALQFIAQALDVQEGHAHHAGALATGLTALEEARDFAISSNRPANAVNAAGIAANHRTPLLRDTSLATISPVVAQQQYFGYAQSQFVLATGGVPAASQILYRLGRLQTAMAAHDADPLALHAPQSIVFHQAALATDGGNWLAANELGVLYARYGQLAEARQLLVHSVTMHPHIEGWHNLAVVHRRLGESELAERAEAEWLQLAQKTAKSTTGAGDMVRWVDPKSFASTGGRDLQAPAEQRYAVTPAATSAAPARR